MRKRNIVIAGALCLSLLLVGCEDSGEIYLDYTDDKAYVEGTDYGRARKGLNNLDNQISQWNNEGNGYYVRREYDSNNNYCYIYITVNEEKLAIQSYDYELSLASMKGQISSCLFGSGIGYDIYVYDMYGEFVKELR